MKNKAGMKMFFWLMLLSLATPFSLPAQTVEESAAAEQVRIYSQEELDRLLAPIALYPDTLLSQVLMAATYPLEVIEADRWIRKNQNLAGDSLDNALQEKSWDVSVKSLCRFPNVLAMMSEKLELTNDIGNAFLSQQEQVMNTIQSLRAKAQAQGNLTSTDKQKVESQEGSIIIEPVNPEVVYVPAYDPCWVYGPWWYPTCAPLWFWSPGIYVGAGFFFGPPIFVGPLAGWCGFRWHRREIFINVNKTFFIHRPGITRMHGGLEVWRHNPVHRRGVTYRNPETGRRFGQVGRPGVEARREFRGFVPGPRVPETGRIGGPPQPRPDTGRLRIPSQPRPETGRIDGPPRPRPDTGRLRIPSQPRPETGRIDGPPQPRPDTGRLRVPSQPRPEAGRTGTGGLGRQPGRSGQGALESFGSSGQEVRQNSQRGHESMGGFGRPQGGGTRAPGSVGGGGRGPGRHN